MTARRVCVVGAGASGLFFARELERLGCQVTVLEAGESVAGKCGSIIIDGRAYDLGGHICTPQYEQLAELAAELAVPTEDTTPYRVYDVSTGQSRPQDLTFFRGDAFRRYHQLRAKHFPDIASAGLAHSARELAAPVGQWLTDHDLTELATSLGSGYTAAGYGYLDSDLSALYLIKYAEMTGLLTNKPPLLGHAGSFTIAGGFASLWQRVADELSDVRCGVTPSAIQRHGKRVLVHIGDDAHEFDDLVITVPLDQILSIMDTRTEERYLADRVRTIEYYTTVCTISGLPRSAFSLMRKATADSAMRGHCVSFHHRYPDSDIYTCYSYGADGLTDSDIVNLLKADIVEMGGQLEKIHAQRRWAFMPHFDSTDIQAGIYDRMENLQGKHRTYYVGSLPAFELVECNLAYTKDIVQRFFAPEQAERQVPLITEATKTRRSFTAEELSDWLVKHIALELRVPEESIDPLSPLGNLALESLVVATLLANLSELLGYRVSPSLFLELPTIDATAKHLAELSRNDDQNRSVPQISPARQPTLALGLTQPRPFFCIGGAIGAAYYLLPLARALGQGQPFYGLQGPGFDGSEEPIDEVEALAARYIDEIKLISPHGPYVLGGHSFGGSVAYEVGRQLRARGDQVAKVILIDAYLVVPGQAEPPFEVGAVIDELWSARQLGFKDSSGGPRRRVDQTLSLQEQREQLGKFLGASGAVPVDEHIANIMRVYQAQVEAAVRYRPGPSDLSVTLIKAEDGFPLTLKGDRYIELYLDEKYNGWEHVEVGSLDVVTIPGDHFNALMPPNLTALADAIRHCLDHIPAPPPPQQLHVESSIHLNPMNPDFLADPYPFYELLRDLAPVYYDEALAGWVLTRHRDVSSVLRDSRVIRPSTSELLTRLPEDVLSEMDSFISWLNSSLPFSNDPIHHQLRTLMGRSFTPRSIEARRPVVERTVEEILDAASERGDIDFMTEVAYLLPSRVVMDLVGIPREDQAQLTVWGREVMSIIGQTQFGADPVSVAYTSKNAADNLISYLTELISERRRRPQDDLISLQLNAQNDGIWISDDVLIANVVALINAGMETTANYIGNSMLALLRNRDQYALLGADPAIIATAAEELLRYDSPAPIITPQQTTEDLTIDVHKIQRGQLIFPVLGAANRDPVEFSDPDRLDLRRRLSVSHLTFGAGPHFCIGAALARIEGQTLFPALARRFPHAIINPKAQPPVFRPDPALRGLESLNLRLHN